MHSAVGGGSLKGDNDNNNSNNHVISAVCQIFEKANNLILCASSNNERLTFNILEEF